MKKRVFVSLAVIGVGALFSVSCSSENRIFDEKIEIGKKTNEVSFNYVYTDVDNILKSKTCTLNSKMSNDEFISAFLETHYWYTARNYKKIQEYHRTNSAYSESNDHSKSYSLYLFDNNTKKVYSEYENYRYSLDGKNVEDKYSGKSAYYEKGNSYLLEGSPYFKRNPNEKKEESFYSENYGYSYRNSIDASNNYDYYSVIELNQYKYNADEYKEYEKNLWSVRYFNDDNYYSCYVALTNSLDFMKKKPEYIDQKVYDLVKQLTDFKFELTNKYIIITLKQNYYYDFGEPLSVDEECELINKSKKNGDYTYYKYYLNYNSKNLSLDDTLEAWQNNYLFENFKYSYHGTVEYTSNSKEVDEYKLEIHYYLDSDVPNMVNELYSSLKQQALLQASGDNRKIIIHEKNED